MTRGKKTFDEAIRELNEAIAHWSDFTPARQWWFLEEALIALFPRGAA